MLALAGQNGEFSMKSFCGGVFALFVLSFLANSAPTWAPIPEGETPLGDIGLYQVS